MTFSFQNSFHSFLRVVIVGRPNVGKSTLFNRLAGSRRALVEDTPGVTRDRREEQVTFFGLPFILVDTAGLEQQSTDPIMQQMWEQTQKGLFDADLILFVVDGRSGLTPDDHFLAEQVRKTGKPVILLGNKCEGKKGWESLYEAYQLGFGDPLPFSAAHGDGTADLAILIERHVFKKQPTPPPEAAPYEKPLELAVIGRPNVGKSTLINKLIGENRFLTGPKAGITRDALGVSWEYKGRQIRLIDTAGLRRQGRIHEALEKMAVDDSLKAVQFCHVAILVLESSVLLEKQDCLLAGHILDEGRGLVLVINKWDLVSNPTKRLKDFQEKLQIVLPQAKGVPVVPVSALTGSGLEKILEKCYDSERLLNTRISTPALNTWLEAALCRHTPPLVQGRRLKIKYITQIKTRPPTFVLFGNQMDELPPSYVKYLTNSLRETFKLPGIPLRFHLRSSKNPYQKK